MRWDAHIAHATGKANRTLGVIRRNLSHCTWQVKNTCYKALVGPQLEYCASVWDPYTAGGVQAVERVQRRATRMVMNDYGCTSSVTEMLQKLKWPTLANRRREARLTTMFKRTHGHMRIPPEQYLISAQRRTRGSHAFKYNTIPATKDCFKFSFFPRSIREWNSLPTQAIQAQSVEAFRASLP
ncbi:hypothetical protein Bbelb_242460 [Branchiostoma belcheri]|nr:hypothetical protein Bbelb_242460 [Branchiostoma belcheri]